MFLEYFKKKLKYKLNEYLISFYSKLDKANIVLHDTVKGENVTIGNNTQIINTILNNNIKIGSDCYLYNVEYGDFSYNSVRVSMMNCKIGKFCSIAENVSIGAGIHPTKVFVSTSPVFYSPHKQCGYSFTKGKSFFKEMGNVIIGNDVWIGLNSVIADDVTIGNGVIIAANSYVNKDVPDFAIVAGNPAKIIKYRFNEEEIEFLLKYKWWEKDMKWLQENILFMHDIKNLKKNYEHDVN